ncbi:MAG: hypothetical protein IPI61_12250 [Syntrophaceae bacterium]|nr:hypothetical protein [Syntrophaceae bacterium]
MEVTTIERLYNRFIEFQMVGQSSQVGEAGVRKETLERIETLFNRDERRRPQRADEPVLAGLGRPLGEPTGQVERTALANAADSLAGMFREYAGELCHPADLNAGRGRGGRAQRLPVRHLHPQREDRRRPERRRERQQPPGPALGAAQESGRSHRYPVRRGNGRGRQRPDLRRPLPRPGDRLLAARRPGPERRLLRRRLRRQPGRAHQRRDRRRKLAGLIDMRDTAAKGYRTLSTSSPRRWFPP